MIYVIFIGGIIALAGAGYSGYRVGKGSANSKISSLEKQKRLLEQIIVNLENDIGRIKIQVGFLTDAMAKMKEAQDAEKKIKDKTPAEKVESLSAGAWSGFPDPDDSTGKLRKPDDDKGGGG